MNKQDKGTLQRYLPEASIDDILGRLQKHKVKFVITNERLTKNGDYRCPSPNNPQHRITVNGNLNPYAFLLVTLHELAHLETWMQYKNRVNPHGREWKNHFASLLVTYIEKNIFPSDLKNAVIKHLAKLPARTLTDALLAKALKHYDTEEQKALNQHLLHVEDIPLNACFRTQNGVVFQKIEKLRTRCKCKNLHNQRLYLVPAGMQVESVSII